MSYDRVGATCSRRSSDERVTVHVVTQDVMLVKIVTSDESDNCLGIRFWEVQCHTTAVSDTLDLVYVASRRRVGQKHILFCLRKREFQ